MIKVDKVQVKLEELHLVGAQAVLDEVIYMCEYLLDNHTMGLTRQKLNNYKSKISMCNHLKFVLRLPVTKRQNIYTRSLEWFELEFLHDLVSKRADAQEEELVYVGAMGLKMVLDKIVL